MAGKTQEKEKVVEWIEVKKARGAWRKSLGRLLYLNLMIEENKYKEVNVLKQLQSQSNVIEDQRFKYICSY